MSTIAEKTKIAYTPAPTGTHLGRCYQFIHIGTVQEEFEGKPKMSNKIRLSFELPTKTRTFKEGEPARPISVHREFTLSMGPKANLRKFVEGMIGTTLKDEEAYGFDTESLVGMPCLLTIKHKTSRTGNVRDEIASVSPLMEGQTCPEQVNPSKILSFNSWDESFFQNLPDFLKNKIMSSEQYQMKNKKLTGKDAEEVATTRDAEGGSDEGGADDINPEDIPF